MGDASTIEELRHQVRELTDALARSEARHIEKMAEGDRRTAELRAILESINDAVYMGDLRGITLANQGALDQLGFASREELNRSVDVLAGEIQTRDALTGEVITAEDQPFSLALRGERVVRNVSVRHRITGEQRIVRSSASPVTIGGEVVGAVAINSDITDHVRAETALQQVNERQAYLLRLSDALRPLSEASEARSIACGLLGEELQADRVYYVDFDSEPEFGLVADDYTVTGLPSLAGRYPVDAFSTTYERHRNGLTWIVQDVLHSADIAEHEAKYYQDRSVMAWIDVPLIKADRLRAVLCVVQTTPRDWTGAEAKLVEETAERLWATVERARAEAQLRKNEERLRIALNAGRMGTWRYDLATGHQQWSEQQFRLFGLEPSEGPPTRELFLSLVHPDDHAAVEFGPEDLRPGRGLLDSEFRIVRPDHQVRCLVAHTSVQHDAAGNAVEMIGVNWDVTAHKEAADQMRVMVAELQHRTRNLIGVVRSIANQTMALTRSAEEFREEFGHRLDALARVQGLLSRANEEPITIDALIRLELDALGGPEDQIKIEGPSVRLRSSAVQTLALALHELATNARKHGALATTHGHLNIGWRMGEREGARWLYLLWREEGMPASAQVDQPRRGYGRELVENALPYALGAETSFELTERELRCTIDLPLGRR